MSEARSLDVGYSSVAIGSGSAGFPSEAGSIGINGPSSIDHGQTDLTRNVIDTLSLAADHGPSLSALDPLAYSDVAAFVAYDASAGIQPIRLNGNDAIGIDQTGLPLGKAPAFSLLPVTELPAIDPRISLGWNDGLSQLMPLASDGRISAEGASSSFVASEGASISRGDLGGRDTRSVDTGNASISNGSNSGFNGLGGDLPITIGKGQADLPSSGIVVPSLLPSWEIPGSDPSISLGSNGALHRYPYHPSFLFGGAPLITAIGNVAETGDYRSANTIDINTSVPSMTGSGQAGTVLSVFHNATLIGSTTVQSGGTWSFSTPALAAGRHDFSVSTVSPESGTLLESNHLDVRVVSAHVEPLLDISSTRLMLSDGALMLDVQALTPSKSGSSAAALDLSAELIVAGKTVAVLAVTGDENGIVSFAADWKTVAAAHPEATLKVSAHTGTDDAIQILDKHTLSALLGQTDRWVSMTSSGESAAFFDAADRGAHIHGGAGLNTVSIANDH
ncbi:Ig-like domain-containing protein [Burkholderia sp. S171]|uniref:Ig-like domain-containing protein n=1 Tax=Burkholderia sp. S171 TaxID=1641860 RepID=UPI00131B2BC8|nr:Ig-like domain-containing protein [Burkholderia sp. S171]